MDDGGEDPLLEYQRKYSVVGGGPSLRSLRLLTLEKTGWHTKVLKWCIRANSLFCGIHCTID